MGPGDRTSVTPKIACRARLDHLESSVTPGGSPGVQDIEETARLADGIDGMGDSVTAFSTERGIEATSSTHVSELSTSEKGDTGVLATVDGVDGSTGAETVVHDVEVQLADLSNISAGTSGPDIWVTAGESDTVTSDVVQTGVDETTVAAVASSVAVNQVLLREVDSLSGGVEVLLLEASDS